jgi:MFS family permease
LADGVVPRCGPCHFYCHLSCVGRTLDLLRHERVARAYFAVLAQSALGNGAGYIALVVVAFERFHSAWAISIILVADLVPAGLFGPILGAAADRWSRRNCLIVSDLLRGTAFLAIGLVDGFPATVALALLAGVGTALFNPASLAAIPSLVKPERLPAATALYGALTDVGFILGPALAALLLLLGPAEVILFANAATFGISALVLSRLSFGAAPAQVEDAGARSGLLREARDGLAALAGMTAIRTVVVASGAMLLAAGLFNVAELPFVKDELDAGSAGFGALTAIYGLGFVAGSLSGSRGGEPAVLKRRFLGGLALVGAGFLACAIAPVLATAVPAFAIAGIGNGLLLVYERLLIQTTVDDSLMARVFGVRDGLSAWAFTAAFVAAGGLIEAFGVRAVLAIAGVGALVVWAVSRFALRHAWAAPSTTRPATG